MPINIPKNLPAGEHLREEKIFVMEEDRAKTQQIRPLNILILNLMPEKEKQSSNYYVYWGIHHYKSILPFEYSHTRV